LAVVCVDYPDIHRRAPVLGGELNLAATYDAHYFALAETERIDLFASDHRLFNTARHRFSWITLVE